MVPPNVELPIAHKKTLRKDVSVTMKQVIQTLKRTDAEKRIPVLRMEIDYELARLHEAMANDDQDMISECKEKLTQFRQELIRLEA